MPDDRAIPAPNHNFERWVGGSPLAVLGRLILISILVGVILAAVGLDPFDIVRSIERLFRSVWEMGFDAVRGLWRYFLLGAVIVIPIWIVIRARQRAARAALAGPAFRRDRGRVAADHRRQRTAVARA